MQRFAEFLATGFYSGRLPKAPGTWGTAVAALLAVALFSLFPGLGTFSGEVLVAAVVTAIAIMSAHYVWKTGLFGAGNDDPQQIVIDEFAGYFVTIIGSKLQLSSFVLGFLLFRVFDITKPFPARNAENLPGGYGIVLDDVAAGIYACLSLKLLEALLF